MGRGEAMTPVCIRGMEGLGDNFHHRAIIRQLLARGETILLATSWPSVYHDLVGERLQLIFPRLRYRTQSNNAQRERDLYSGLDFPPAAKIIEMDFKPHARQRFTSVLDEMYRSFSNFSGMNPARADFRMSVPPSWAPELLAQLSSVDKPIMFYRPLVDRSNWKISKIRNPDFTAYARLYRAIRDQFYVVSVADLKQDEEWIVGEDVDVDLKFHAGELGVRELCVLADMSAVVFSSPGFAIPLAQAVGAPTVAVFGSFENSASFSAGARFTPYCAIDTESRCRHFLPVCNCSKTINMDEALPRLEYFINEYCGKPEHSREVQAA